MCSEIHTKDINTLCGQNAVFAKPKRAASHSATVLYTVHLSPTVKSKKVSAYPRASFKHRHFFYEERYDIYYLVTVMEDLNYFQSIINSSLFNDTVTSKTFPDLKQIYTKFSTTNVTCSHKLVGKPEGRRPLGRPRRRWVDNIRMDLQEVGCGYMDWIGLNHDRDRWRSLVSAVMNLRVP